MDEQQLKEWQDRNTREIEEHNKKGGDTVQLILIVGVIIVLFVGFVGCTVTVTIQ